MEQRRLRLGDILDDYCPRERRLTNHAIVAMIEDDIKQTRCTTCDAEHAYKGGKLPKRRKKEEGTAALYKEVLAGQPNPDNPNMPVEPDAEHIDEPVSFEQEEPAVMSSSAVDAPTEPIDHDDADGASEEHADPQPDVEEGPVHRPLIRAQLPRIEGQKEERRLPEFTIRQRGTGHFRGDSRPKQNRHAGNGHGGNSANGNHSHGGPRFAGPRPAGGSGRSPQGRGGGQPGFRSGQRPGGGRKRSR